MSTRDISLYLVDRYSERKESAEELMRRVTPSHYPHLSAQRSKAEKISALMDQEGK